MWQPIKVGQLKTDTVTTLRVGVSGSRSFTPINACGTAGNVRSTVCYVELLPNETPAQHDERCTRLMEMLHLACAVKRTEEVKRLYCTDDKGGDQWTTPT